MDYKKILNNKREPLEGPLIIEPKVFKDKRGFFLESWNRKKMENILKKDINFVQDNHSFSQKGVLRGMHYQVSPFQQSKLIRCLSGEIYDVVVDLRKNSKTFGTWAGIILNDKNLKEFWIPAGFAHGFITLSNSANVIYKTDAYWDKKSENALIWNDKTINIKWPETICEIIISDKDREAKTLNELKNLNLLL